MKLAALLLAAALVACGGGGSSSPVSGIIAPAAPPRHDLLMGYFAGISLYVQEQVGHVNLYWAADFGTPTTDGVLEQMATLTQAKGLSTVISMPFCHTPVAQGESEARTWLQRLHNAGLLAGAVAVSWCDEADTVRSGQWSDADATAMTAAVRRGMATFPELTKTAIAGTFACDTGRTPGMAALDWVGCDHYPSGCGVLTKYVEGLRSLLKPGQRLFLLPGGADPWRQDPACFENYANAHQEVVAIVPFIWQTVTDDGVTYTGIRDNPTKPLYVEMGQRIKG